MNNGIKIGILGTIAVLVAYLFFRLFSQTGDEVLPSSSGNNPAATTTKLPNQVRAPNGVWYKPDANGQPDMSKPVNTAGGALNEVPGASSANRTRTTIAFDKTEHNFGVLNQGDKKDCIFRFTNTGSEPLIIEDCHASCGCTVPQWPKVPIAPGKSDEIRVAYNSAGKQGAQSKDITITANTTPVTIKLNIKANVLVDPNAPQNPDGIIVH